MTNALIVDLNAEVEQLKAKLTAADEALGVVKSVLRLAEADFISLRRRNRLLEAQVERLTSTGG